MSLDETVTSTGSLESSVPLPTERLDRRVLVALRHPSNWLQLFRFAVVGASGYLVNLTVFWFVLEFISPYRTVAAIAAFIISVANNFFWNRRWTFASQGHVGFQAMRFYVVSIVAFFLTYGLMELMVWKFSFPALLAQATALVIATPVNFLGNRLWSFRR